MLKSFQLGVKLKPNGEGRTKEAEIDGTLYKATVGEKEK